MIAQQNTPHTFQMIAQQNIAQWSKPPCAIITAQSLIDRLMLVAQPGWSKASQPDTLWREARPWKLEQPDTLWREARPWKLEQSLTARYFVEGVLDLGS